MMIITPTPRDDLGVDRWPSRCEAPITTYTSRNIDDEHVIRRDSKIRPPNLIISMVVSGSPKRW